MGFQIVELELDKNDNVVERKVVPHPYASRDQAERQIESLISKYEDYGYSEEHDYWWVRAANDDRMRFIIEAV